jgi:hypothetical protein
MTDVLKPIFRRGSLVAFHRSRVVLLVLIQRIGIQDCIGCDVANRYAWGWSIGRDGILLLR